MTTATTVLTDLLDAIVNRLGDIANELRSDLGNPALAEVRAAAAATERAYVLLSPWDEFQGCAAADDVIEAVSRFIERTEGIPMPPDEHFHNATFEQTSLKGPDYVKMTMPGCVYLVLGEVDSVDGEDLETKTVWHVVGRYPQ